ncbi:MAG: substrate-binding domain-containing protein [Betaproteobacteria bacterium]
MRTQLAVILVALAVGAPAFAQEPVNVQAAGGLRGVINEPAGAFTASSGVRVAPEFGASRLLRDRIDAGTDAQAFAWRSWGPRPSRAGRAVRLDRLPAVDQSSRRPAVARPHPLS